MGLYTRIEAIDRINTLLRTIEQKITTIQKECGFSNLNIDKIQIEARTICVLMNEIIEISNSSDESVCSATYLFFNENISLKEVSMAVKHFISICDNLYISSLKSE